MYWMTWCCRISSRSLMPVSAPATCTKAVLPLWWILAHTMTMSQLKRSSRCTQFGADVCVHYHVTGENETHIRIKQSSTWHVSLSYVAPQFFIFRRTVQIAPNCLHWNAHIFLFGLILLEILNSLTPQTTLCLLPFPVRLPVPVNCAYDTPPPPPLLHPPFIFPVPDRRALQQLALNVYVKNSDLTCTWPSHHLLAPLQTLPRDVGFKRDVILAFKVKSPQPITNCLARNGA